MYQLRYFNELDTKAVEKKYNAVLKQLSAGDFKSAEVKKMANTGYYRARLDIKDRLLFSIARFNGSVFILILELIQNHDYANSRFLRGAVLPDESQFTLITKPEEVEKDIKELSFINSKQKYFHYLNKIISFDDIQQSIFNLNPPLIIIGSAGSGKTVLLLEKLKQLSGSILYVSLSNYLVENARKLYYSKEYENAASEVDFLSYHQYIESWKIPKGKEVNFKLFEGWFNKHTQYSKHIDSHRIYEEFKGVISGSPVHTAYLSKEEYLNLGIKQSIFTSDKRDVVYTIYLKYLDWLKESNLFDINLVSFEHLSLINKKYDYLVVDEVQDLTGVQLNALMKSLNTPGNFILTGDSNQIVHPNFFSWSKIKSYFYTQGQVDGQIQVLQTNYRNSKQVVDLSNKLLKIKNTRFGSIDRESNYLINTISEQRGEVVLLNNDDKIKNELNNKTQNSTHYAVIVSDNQYKEQARKYFKTPLVFSVQEAKGLEYENVILLNFISAHPAAFNEIINGVKPEDLNVETLNYSRAANKEDKDGEVYKFFINSFYVAITRSIQNIYLFESEINHKALHLLGLQESKKEIGIKAQQSNKEEWLAEAQRLEEQGKFEQAEMIRAKYLGYDYLSDAQLEIIKSLALDPAKKEHEVKKERKQLFQYAQVHFKTDLIDQLAKLQFQRAMVYMKELRQQSKEFVKACRIGRLDTVKQTTTKFGINFRDVDTKQTGLMMAALYGQENLISYFIDNNANIKLLSSDSLLAFEYLVLGFYKTAMKKENQFCTQKQLSKFWHLLKPQTISILNRDKRIVLNTHSMGFNLVSIMKALDSISPEKVTVKFHDTSIPSIVLGAYTMSDFEFMLSFLPDEVMPAYRKKRQYANSVLAQHEKESNNPYNKELFCRAKRGVYFVNYNMSRDE